MNATLLRIHYRNRASTREPKYPIHCATPGRLDKILSSISWSVHYLLRTAANDPLSGQQLTDDKMAHILITPIHYMRGYTSNDIKTERCPGTSVSFIRNQILSGIGKHCERGRR